MTGFVFHGGVFPYQGRDGNDADLSLIKGEVTLPSIGGEFTRKDGPWILPPAGKLGSGRIRSVERSVRGKALGSDFETTVECTIEDLKLPSLALTATKLVARLVSTFGPNGRTFDEHIEIEGLAIGSQSYGKDDDILARVKGQSAASLRGTSDTVLMSHLATANPQGLAGGSGDNVACYVVDGTPVVTSSNANVVMGEYSIGEDARRLTMLRIDNPASPDDSIVLLQLFVNGHRPP